MPVDYTNIDNPVYFPFDKKQFIDSLCSLKLFHNTLITKKFAKKWADFLYAYDLIWVEEGFDFSFQHFPIGRNFSNSFSYWSCINIEKTIHAILEQEENIPLLTLEVAHFGVSQQYSKETPITYCYDESSIFSEAPIIILSSDKALKRSFVLDGNHRVSFAKDFGFKHISAYCIDDYFLLKNGLFANRPSFIFYLFLMDLHYLQVRKPRTKNLPLISFFYENKLLTKNTYLYHFSKGE